MFVCVQPAHQQPVRGVHVIAFLLVLAISPFGSLIRIFVELATERCWLGSVKMGKMRLILLPILPVASRHRKCPS